MQTWRRQVTRAALSGLWYLFGLLIYQAFRHRPFPSWADLPGYLTRLAGFVIGCVAVQWWFDRRARRKDR